MAIFFLFHINEVYVHKPFECRHCHKKLMDENNDNNNIARERIYKEDNPFIYSHCIERLAVKCNLKKYIRIHTI